MDKKEARLTVKPGPGKDAKMAQMGRLAFAMGCRFDAKMGPRELWVMKGLYRNIFRMSKVPFQYFLNLENPHIRTGKEMSYEREMWVMKQNRLVLESLLERGYVEGMGKEYVDIDGKTYDYYRVAERGLRALLGEDRKVDKLERKVRPAVMHKLSKLGIGKEEAEFLANILQVTGYDKEAFRNVVEPQQTSMLTFGEKNLVAAVLSRNATAVFVGAKREDLQQAAKMLKRCGAEVHLLSMKNAEGLYEIRYSTGENERVLTIQLRAAEVAA